MNSQKYKFSIIFFLNLYLLYFYPYLKKTKKKVGVIGLRHGNNIGNNLLKYAMYIKLKQLGYDPYIVGLQKKNTNITFIKNTIKIRILKKTFSEINKNDYDILMVNSDQTWRKSDRHFYNHAFLNFAKNWSIPKFIYGASLGKNYWILTKKDEKIGKSNLKDFKGISFREKGTINLIKNHLGFTPILVLDPTLLIDKRYYLYIIKNFKSNINPKDKYIFTYLLFGKKKVKDFIKKASTTLDYNIYNVKTTSTDHIKKFIYGIVHCKSVITDSYHGTIFSIIFNKSFITLYNINSFKERFLSLKELLKLENRIISDKKTPNLTLLTTPLNIDYNLINALRIKSINYLKKNLNSE